MTHQLCLALAVCLTPLPGTAIERDAQSSERLEKLRDEGAALAKRRCPKPVRIANKSVANIHDPNIIDVVRTYSCPGAQISIYRANATKPAAELLDGVIVTDPKRTFPPGVKVGTSRATLEAQFGAPDKEDGNTLDYYVDAGPGADVISFKLRQGRVSRIVWAFHLE